MSKPMRLFTDDTVDSKALEQFESAMQNEYAVAGALMPDANAGYSLPIGGVVATEGAIFPAWVGYDIGCGMCALQTNLTKEDIIPLRTQIFEEIKSRIPMGFHHHNLCADEIYYVHDNWFRFDTFAHSKVLEVLWKAFDGYNQLGTLGGGNHFIEIGYDEENLVWIIIHSGSRGIGWNLAKHYMCVAANSEKPLEGHYPIVAKTDRKLFDEYITDMNFCLHYALVNRKHMITEVLQVLSESIPKTLPYWERLINRNHNHIDCRDGMWIHRKGATHAEDGMMGVVPGNMKHGAFIVRGKGNPDSLWSSSHGAGRVLGRNQAKRTLKMEEFTAAMEGITAVVDEGTLDESPMAYKNIFEVMALQKDLVEIIHHVKPLINLKGK